MNNHPKKGFTLIELLTVIAIIGILASILIPTVSKVRESARRAIDMSNLRQIGQASLIYANDNNDRLPSPGMTVNYSAGANAQINDIHTFAGALAVGGGLNDASIWVSASDNSNAILRDPSTVLNQNRNGLEQGFSSADLSFAVAGGLNMGHSSTTPIGWTRGLQTNGEWANGGVYGSDGGHIVFMGGNVSWRRNLTTQQNQLIDSQNGQRTSDLGRALPQNAVVWGQGTDHSTLGKGG